MTLNLSAEQMTLVNSAASGRCSPDSASLLSDFDGVHERLIAASEAPEFTDWANSDRMVWPPPQAPLAAILAASMTPPPDPRFTANWAAAREKEVAQRAAVEERWAKEAEARQAESRRAYEASLRR
jgi:hypothetical protein